MRQSQPINGKRKPSLKELKDNLPVKGLNDIVFLKLLTIERLCMSIIYSAKSFLHGDGVFASKNLYVDDKICCNRHIVKNGFNHSCKANAKLINGGEHIIVILDIAKDEEITVDYYIT